MALVNAKMAAFLRKKKEDAKMAEVSKEVVEVENPKIEDFAPPKPKKTFAQVLAEKKARLKEEKAADAKENELIHSLQKAIHGEGTVNKNEVSFDMLNERQKEAVSLAESFEPFILTGAAGTGKTTTQKMVIETLLRTGRIRMMPEATKYLEKNAPAIAVVSFTNVAVRNIAEVVPAEIKNHCITIHKLLEFAPEKEIKYERTKDGDIIEKKVMNFYPRRNGSNPLTGLQLVIIEEASNVGVRLFEQLVDACPDDCNFMFLGDINQLKPVTDDGILGYKFLELPVIELTEVHRQAQDSKILSFAHKILSGVPPVTTEKMIEDFKKEGELEFIKFKVRLEAEDVMPAIGNSFKNKVLNGEFIPGRDIILCPWAKGGHVNTNEINRYIAQGFSEKDDRLIYHVIAGRNVWYLAEGDTIYYNKDSWMIDKIEKNPQYAGRPPMMPSKTMDRWGNDPNAEQEDFEMFLQPIAEDERMEELSAEERVNQSSHIVYLRNIADEENFTEIHTAGDFGDSMFSFGYSLTVHKAQGSEWQNVTLVLHHSHAMTVSRELLYTAVTRARKKLTILFDDGKTKYDPNSILRKGIISSQIKGNTLKDKINYFTEKIVAKERLAKFRKDKEMEKVNVQQQLAEEFQKQVYGDPAEFPKEFDDYDDDIPF